MNRFETKHINNKCNKSFIAKSLKRENCTKHPQGEPLSDKNTTFSFLPVTVSSRATSRLSMLFEYNPVTTRYCNHLHLITLANYAPNTSTIVATASGVYPLDTPTVTLLNYPIVGDPNGDHHNCKNIV